VKGKAMSKIFKKRDYIYAWLAFLLCWIGGFVLFVFIAAFTCTLIEIMGYPETAGYIESFLDKFFDSFWVLILLLVMSFIAFILAVRIMVVRKIEKRIEKLTTGEKDEDSKEGD